MAPQSGAAMVAEIILQGHINRTGQVACQVVISTVRPVKSPPHIEDHRRLTCAQPFRQFRHGDEHLAPGHRGSGRPKSIWAAGLAIAVTIPVPKGPLSSNKVALPIAIPSR